MSIDCDFNVYRRERGETKKELLAKFKLLRDAINFAHSYSNGLHRNDPTISMMVLHGGRVKYKFIQGEYK